MDLKKFSIKAAESGYLPTFLLRSGIKQLLRKRLLKEGKASERELIEFGELLQNSPIAIKQSDANKQHYEVPTNFYRSVLGPQMKYSGCYFPTGNETLEQAELKSLDLVGERAQLSDGQSILELGCGWGSFTLWAAAKFPNSQITAISNSRTQREYIEKEAAHRGLSNIQVITADISSLSLDRTFSRIVSIEMLEHMRNYQALFQRISKWLEPDGKFFVHIFCHKDTPYLFEDEANDDWMARYFFSGGTMPSFGLFDLFQQDLRVIDRWKVNGTHYGLTARAWEQNLLRNRNEVLKLFSEKEQGGESAETLFQRWRLFFLACEELFNFNEGEEWFVGHYLLEAVR